MELGSADAATLWGARLAGAPFAAALAKGAPLFVACGDPPQVVFATPAALAAFGAADASALDAVLFAPAVRAARRLRRLAAETPVDAPPRLEMLRVFVARKPVNRSWLCARLTRDGVTFFVAADVAASPAEEPAPAPAPRPRPCRRRRCVSSGGLTARAGSARPTPRSSRRWAARRRARARPWRRCAPVSGSTPRWSEGVAARRTFSRLRVVWPAPDGQGRVAWLSGAPLFGAGRAYQGFAGFGLLSRGARRRDAPARPRAAEG